MAKTSKKESILIVDDAPDMLELLQRNLSAEGYQAFTAPSVSEAIKFLESTPVDLVITDLKMPIVSGMDLVRHVRENLKKTQVIMITGYATVESAVEAMKTGADEYLAKPFTDEELVSAVRRTLDKLDSRVMAQGESHFADMTRYGLLGTSPAIQKVFSAIAKAAKSDATVLITGESGTGKELVARAIHYSSERAQVSFVPVNCGGIPEGLLESELFGHMRGAFTGATASRAGFFQTADGGTIFLDEISDTSLGMQAKLLRVLQDKHVVMVGANRPLPVDVRILAATNRDLRTAVINGTFREDLFFRINVISIDVPALRERGPDILLLAHHFAEEFSDQAGKPVPRISDRALEVLRDYHWPGNIRELENVIHRIVVMTDGDIIDVPDLPKLMRFSALRASGLYRSLADVEIDHIRNVLASVEDNKTRAAEILGIDRKTLRRKLRGA